jgi:hypothetical protein
MNKIKYNKMLQNIEETLVNGKRCTLSKYSQYNSQMKADENNGKISLVNFFSYKTIDR